MYRERTRDADVFWCLFISKKMPAIAPFFHFDAKIAWDWCR